MSNRIEVLDSLRGIAASAVVVQHVLLSSGINAPSAHWAVIMFFVLSGCVLAIPWIEGRPPHWANFITRRVCRLWPPVVGAVLLSLFLYAAIGSFPTGADRVDADLLTRCLLLTGQHGGCVLDTPLWSLVYELRISLLFPLLIAATLRFRAAAVILALIVSAELEIVVWMRGLPLGGEFSGDGFALGFATTVHYMCMFILGTVIASRVTRGASMAVAPAVPLVVLAILLICQPSDTGEALGSALLVVSVTGCGPLKAALLWAPLKWIGKVSYSLYLVHLPVTLAVLHETGGTAIGMTAAFVLSAIMAEVMYRLVEAPSITLARRLRRSPPDAGRHLLGLAAMSGDR